MKLYTKEQFLIAAKKCEVSMIDAEHIMKYIDEYVSPIELPSDEEIETIALIHLGGCSPESNDERIGFIRGARFMKRQIEKSNK